VTANRQNKMQTEYYFIVRSKAISYTAFNLILRTQSVKPLNRSSPNTLFVSEFLGAKKTWEAMWVNNLPKVATQYSSGMAGLQTPDLSALKP